MPTTPSAAKKNDTTAPLLSYISPLDNAIMVPTNANIVLQFNEEVIAGTGFIRIFRGLDLDRVINVTDTKQVTFDAKNKSVIINPTADLAANTDYNIQIDPGVITDKAWNAFAGIIGPDALNFSTIDTIAPTVSNVSASTTDGHYKAGAVIDVTVQFSEVVTVTGTPQLTLETGAIDRVVNYLSGSGTNTLTFRYTVQAGDTSADLDYLSTTALTLNAGTIKDAAGLNAILTLPTPGSTHSLGANKNIIVDTTAPAITINTIATDDIINASEVNSTISVTTEAGATVNLSIGGNTRTAAVTDNTWSYTLIPADISAMGQGADSISATATDQAGNVASATRNIGIDTIAPTAYITDIDISDDTGISDTDFVTKIASQTITASQIGVIAPDETLWVSVDNGSTWRDPFAGSAPTGNGVDVELIEGSNKISFKVTDAAGNEGPVASQNYLLDTTAPIVELTSTTISGIGDVMVKSNEDGIVYLVNDTIPVGSLSDITTADPSMWNAVSVEAHNTIELNTAGLVNGQYAAYAVDDAGNLSSPAADKVTLQPDDTVVIFDLVNGASSSHSGRVFSPDVDYQIYVLVDTTQPGIDISGWAANASSSMWSNGRSLSPQDQITFIRDDRAAFHITDKVGRIYPGTAFKHQYIATNGLIKNALRFTNITDFGDRVSDITPGERGLLRYKATGSIRASDHMGYGGLQTIRIWQNSSTPNDDRLDGPTPNTLFNIVGVPPGLMTSQGLV